MIGIPEVVLKDDELYNQLENTSNLTDRCTSRVTFDFIYMDMFHTIENRLFCFKMDEEKTKDKNGRFKNDSF